MTRRQQDLASHWPIPAVYTPGFVLDGKEWRGWNRATIPYDDSKSPIALKIEKEDDGRFTVSVTGLKANQNYTIRIAKLGMNLSTDVKSGENAGRKLNHNFVVLDWKSEDATSKSPQATFKLDDVPKTVSKKASKTAIAAWIELAGNPAPLQATGADL
jgi:hypothetical protein